MLIVSWMISVILSRTFEWNQLIVLFFLLLGLNAADGFSIIWKRKSESPFREKFWTFIYFLFSIVSGIWLMYSTESVRLIIPICLSGGLIYLILAKMRMQKTILSEWLIFSIIALSGFCAFNPFEISDLKFIFPVWLLLSIYFGQSIFVVKLRVGETSVLHLIAYFFVSMLIVFFVFPFEGFSVSVLLIMLLKSILVLVSGKFFFQMKLKYIGLTETFFSLLIVSAVFVQKV